MFYNILRNKTILVRILNDVFRNQQSPKNTHQEKEGIGQDLSRKRNSLKKPFREVLLGNFSRSFKGITLFDENHPLVSFKKLGFTLLYGAQLKPFQVILMIGSLRRTGKEIEKHLGK